MAKFPAEAERSVTVKVPLRAAFDYLWDVVGSSNCIPGIRTCKRVGTNTYRFLYEDKYVGPLTISVQYTARYESNGKDRITFESIDAGGDTADASGTIRFQAAGSQGTRIALRQMLAPDSPVPRLIQGLFRSTVEREVAEGVRGFLDNVKAALESA
jgi:carbon monoxide dehydrogenase subunit G